MDSEVRAEVRGDLAYARIKCHPLTAAPRVCNL